MSSIDQRRRGQKVWRRDERRASRIHSRASFALVSAARLRYALGMADETPEQALAPMTADVARTLVENHRAFLAFLERRVGSRAVAEDILQDAFIRGLGKLDTLRNDESAVAWFYRALRNAVIDHHRRHAAANKALAAFATELEHDAQTPTGETDEAVCACVTRLATTLKPEYAHALQRIEVAGLAVKGFADELGISPSNAAVRVFRAREALRRRVMESCGTCATHGCMNCTCSGSASAATDR